jgi:hypothetical protein
VIEVSSFKGTQMSWYLPFHLRTETELVSETLCFLVLEYRTMDKIQKPSNSEYYIESSEPFIYYSLRNEEVTVNLNNLLRSTVVPIADRLYMSVFNYDFYKIQKK